MNYDNSISSEVSLSKVLDEMIMDGTDFKVVVAFLESHESQIEDIYRHSAFAYDLYDLAAHPYRINAFLARHVIDLPDADMCFASAFLANLLFLEDIYPEIMKELRDNLQGNSNLIHFRSRGYKGRFMEDAKVASGDMDFNKLIEAISADKRDVKMFLQESYLARSMLMAGNFLRFSTRAQYVILSSIGDIFGVNEWSARSPIPYLAHALNTLLKQLLVSGETDMFNWVVNVLRLNNPTNALILEKLWSDQFERIPSVLRNMFHKALQTFEEIVFEMNMMETQFDVMDLFIYIYIHSPKIFKGMRENPELLEFFNLPFDWNELEKLRSENLKSENLKSDWRV